MEMDPPSTPAPVALRGWALDAKLGEIAPDRPAPASGQVASFHPIDPRIVMAEAERQADLDAPASDAPMSLRGRDLEEALEVARRGPRSVSGTRPRVTMH
jgi:hypothetical protein